MYEVYINERQLVFSRDGLNSNGADMLLKLSGSESTDHMRQLIASFENASEISRVVLQSLDIDRSWLTFCSLYKIISAAGGMVYNHFGHLLLIFRNGKWDLPKGKIEEGEEPDAAAIREVNEECGIGFLELKKQIRTTYHTYPYKNDRVLKKTYWFLMTTKDNAVPVPQHEEGIIDAKWMSKAQVFDVLPNAYNSIATLIRYQMDDMPADLLG